LLDGRDDAPGGTSGSDDVLVGNGQKVSLVNSEFSAKLVFRQFEASLCGCPLQAQVFDHTFATSFMYVTISS
jgi:hypothetical protein